MNPYYQDDLVTLYHGDMREVLPRIGQFDACVTDPPYGETSLAWDRWLDGWPALVAEHTSSMWCFGSMRMFLDRVGEFADWKFSQDVVWEKHNGSGFQADRFRRVHEHATHWYRGPWRSLYHVVPRIPMGAEDNRRATKRRSQPAHTGTIEPRGYDAPDRQARSVVFARSCHGGIQPTEKPRALLAPLIEYAVPAGGVVLDVFGGSASTALTARQLGRRAVVIEANEAHCEAAATRLSVPDLFSGAVS